MAAISSRIWSLIRFGPRWQGCQSAARGGAKLQRGLEKRGLSRSWPETIHRRAGRPPTRMRPLRFRSSREAGAVASAGSLAAESPRAHCLPPGGSKEIDHQLSVADRPLHLSRDGRLISGPGGRGTARRVVRPVLSSARDAFSDWHRLRPRRRPRRPADLRPKTPGICHSVDAFLRRRAGSQHDFGVSARMRPRKTTKHTSGAHRRKTGRQNPCRVRSADADPSGFSPWTPWRPQERKRGRAGRRRRLDRAAMPEILQEAPENYVKMGRLH